MITSVIVSYWPKRRKNIPRIVQALKDQTIPPDYIIVINNDKSVFLREQDVGVPVLNSGMNFTSRSKYAIALLIPSDQYLLLDDDVLPGTGVIENFLRWSTSTSGLSDYGIRAVNNFFHQGLVFKGHEITAPEWVDGFIGRTQFLSMTAIVRMLEAETKVRLGTDYVFDGEDILIALANPDSYIVPTPPEAYVPIIDGSQTVSMQDDWGYHIVRDMFALHARQKLGLEIFEGDTPGNEYDLDAFAKYREQSRMRT